MGSGSRQTLKQCSGAAGSQGANVALRLLKERADTAEARAASAVKQISELKASLQVQHGCACTVGLRTNVTAEYIGHSSGLPFAQACYPTTSTRVC